jgi:hypothetical protein
LYQLNRPREFSSFFGPVRFESSPPFSPPRCRLSSCRCRHTIEPIRARCLHFIFWQCFVPLHSRAKIKALNSHHRHRPPSLDRLTPTLHCYKKVISTLVTLLTTQSCLYFASSLAAVIPFHCRTTPIIHSHNDTHGDKLVVPLSLPE